MGNIIYSKNQHNLSLSQKNNSLTYVLNTQKPLHDAKKPAIQNTQLHQPKKISFFKAPRITSSKTPLSEVDRIIAGMQRRT